MTEHFIGLMSGTSLDGADGVLARMDDLGLVVGSDVVALVKSTEVSIAKL